MKVKVPFRKYSPLELYLEGGSVPQDWVDSLLLTRSKEHKAFLYRLSVLSNPVRVGAKIRTKKKLISASDKIEHAIYAGCNFHKEEGTDLSDKYLALLEIPNPTILMSMKDIESAVPKVNKFAHIRLNDEREYLILGPVVGKVIQLVDKKILKGRKFYKLI